MLDPQTLRITGMDWGQGLLWLACARESLVASYNPRTTEAELKLTYSHPVADVCPADEGLWLIAGGGRLGWQFVLWSREKRRVIRTFDCPEGAASGMSLQDGKLWTAHRRNRKLFCLDPQDGNIRWVIPTDRETFSPTAHRGELWFIECDPGPLAHWGRPEQARYAFIRYDVAREKVAERLSLAFVPACMAFDGERFWYARPGRDGLCSVRYEALTKE